MTLRQIASDASDIFDDTDLQNRMLCVDSSSTLRSSSSIHTSMMIVALVTRHWIQNSYTWTAVTNTVCSLDVWYTLCRFDTDPARDRFTLYCVDEKSGHSMELSSGSLSRTHQRYDHFMLLTEHNSKSQNSILKKSYRERHDGSSYRLSS